MLEKNSINDNNYIGGSNLSKEGTEYNKFLKLHDNTTRQKARVRWIQEGDANLAFFHGFLKNKRKSLTIQKSRTTMEIGLRETKM